VTPAGAPRLDECPVWVLEAVRGGIVTARRARWGFRHETWIVERPGGERMVLQRRVDGSDPTLGRARIVRELVRAASVPTPEPVRRHVPTPGSSGLVVELPFVDAQVGAELLPVPHGAETVGRLCGSIAVRLGGIDVRGLRLADTWASGARLRTAAGRWLELLPASAPSGTRRSVEQAISRASVMLDADPPGLAHGDLAPVNVLVRDGDLAAVLDLDRAQIAHPAYDAAWFAWVVTFHHPRLADTACAAYTAAAGVPTGEEALGWLWSLLLLERLAEAADPRERSMWADRLVGRAPGS
jgi:aminoglycoside phosphotransferase (APT) family kinase protein